MNQRDKDMYLPFWVCILGIVFLIGACVCLELTLSTSVYSLIGFVICLSLGAAEILCWKNQGVKIVDDNTFIYTTMFGREKHYCFSEIRELKKNSDSFTLVLDNGKVHIESCAIMSERFVNSVDSALKRLYDTGDDSP
ncbi:MAG: hypothetical protein IKO22_06625 [Oscillospiraceae bacterium]|nr:hypothetical protein [Oscillospiraceae bacterium]